MTRSKLTALGLVLLASVVGLGVGRLRARSDEQPREAARPELPRTAMWTPKPSQGVHLRPTSDSPAPTPKPQRQRRGPEEWAAMEVDDSVGPPCQHSSDCSVARAC